MSDKLPYKEQGHESEPTTKKTDRVQASRYKKKLQLNKKHFERYSTNLKYLSNIPTLVRLKGLLDEAGQTGILDPAIANSLAEQQRESMAKTFSVANRIVKKIVPSSHKFKSYWLPTGIEVTDMKTILDHHEAKTKAALVSETPGGVAEINKIARDIGSLTAILNAKKSELTSLHEQRCNALTEGNTTLADQLKIQIDAKKTEIATIEADLTKKKSEKAAIDDELKKIADEYINFIKTATHKK